MSTSRSTGCTVQDARALAHIASRLREETVGCCTWDIEGTIPVFTRVLVGKNLQIATELVLAHATDPDAKTPGAITRKFTPERRKPTESLNPTPETACRRCGGFKGNCACVREQLAYDATSEPARATDPDRHGADLARALLGITQKETP